MYYVLYGQSEPMKLSVFICEVTEIKQLTGNKIKGEERKIIEHTVHPFSAEYHLASTVSSKTT